MITVVLMNVIMLCPPTSDKNTLIDKYSLIIGSILTLKRDFGGCSTFPLLIFDPVAKPNPLSFPLLYNTK